MAIHALDGRRRGTGTRLSAGPTHPTRQRNVQMHSRDLRNVSLALLVVITAAGCSSRPDSVRKPEPKVSGPSYHQAMDLMYPDALKAVKSSLPKEEVQEVPGGTTECGGSDVVDGKDASKLIATSTVRVGARPTEQRKPAALVGQVAARLQSTGWKPESGRPTTPPGEPGGVERQMKKPDVDGTAIVSAAPIRLTSGKISQTVAVQVVTGCLRNPAWHKS
ncbi:hypothetical protein OG217_21345 [Streptomyces sp. NBC_01023]|uniref:hypothetical protein n=1 Tax=unclassified Streptomyces TaxID=2593676 RepID=UPI0030DF7ABE|nr:hypothetical protein OG217_21345 [Streptomyces sp. NBC_01023]